MKIIADLHTHTIASGHAYSTIMENAAQASKNGLEFLGTADHAPGMADAPHMSHFINMKVWPRELFGVYLLRGIEANIVDTTGNIGLPDNLSERLDYAVASLHEGLFPSQLGIAANTDAAVNAMSHPKVCIIGHPDDSRFPLDYDLLAHAANQHEVALELNNSSLSPVSFRKNSLENATQMLQACIRNDTHIILSSDSHIATDIGRFDRVLSLLKHTRFPENLVINSSTKNFESFMRKYLKRAMNPKVMAD
jgi:putative hydrolase